MSLCNRLRDCYKSLKVETNKATKRKVETINTLSSITFPKSCFCMK